METLLILNPGSTSTKIAVYAGETPRFTESISHDSDAIAKYERVADQYEFRRDLILQVLERHGVALGDLDAIVARGGVLPPIAAGAYEVNDDMVWQLRHAPVNEHASNLGAIIAKSIADGAGIPAYIYDGVTVDEMIPVARVCGLPQMTRRGIGHNLNMRAAAMRYARERNKRYDECSVVVAHLGGGISVSVHHKGRIVDIVSDEEGPFSPERAGGLPNPQLVEMAFSGDHTCESLKKVLKSRGGLVAWFGTNDTRVVEKRAMEGDERAKLVYDAMALAVSKFIGAESTVIGGRPEAILLTGGVAHSEYFTGEIRRRVEHIAPVVVYAGENEMESLALGGLRVLRGQEKAGQFRRKTGDAQGA